MGASIKACARSHREDAHSGDRHNHGAREAYDIVGAWHPVYSMPSPYPAVKRTGDRKGLFQILFSSYSSNRDCLTFSVWLFSITVRTISCEYPLGLVAFTSRLICTWLPSTFIKCLIISSTKRCTSLPILVVSRSADMKKCLLS